MKRMLVGFKETYAQVGDFEYNQINPYLESKRSIKEKYPNAKITSTQTVIENFGALQVPVLIMRYEI